MMEFAFATPDQLREDPHLYSRRVVGWSRRLRMERDWSARQLAEMSDAYCKALGPQLPIRHTLTRARISKLENRITHGVTVEEQLVLAGVFGVPFTQLVSGLPSPQAAPADSQGIAIPMGPQEMAAQILDLEACAARLRIALGAVGMSAEEIRQRFLPQDITGVAPDIE